MEWVRGFGWGAISQQGYLPSNAEASFLASEPRLLTQRVSTPHLVAPTAFIPVV